MNWFNSLLALIGLRSQARAAGATSKEANTAAITAVVLEELAKQAAKEAEAKKDAK